MKIFKTDAHSIFISLFRIIVTVSLVITDVAWFTLVAEEGEWQQELPGQRCLLSCGLPDIHNLHF